MEKSKISSFLLVISRIILAGGIFCFFVLPMLYDMFSENTAPFFNHHVLYQIAFYACYIICLIIIWILAKILTEIYKESPFKKEIEVALKRIAVLFMSLAVIVGVKVIFIPTLLSIAVIFMTFIASLSFYVLSQIFKVAIEYKHEIDYTV